MFGNSILAGQAHIRISAENLVPQALARVQGQLRKFSDNITRIGSQITNLGLAGSTIGAGLSVGLGSAIRSASTATETLAAFRGVFGDISDSAEESAQNIAIAFRRAETDIRKFQVGFFSFLRGAGFDTANSRQLTGFLTQATLDFASRFEVPDTEAFERFLSGLAGSSEVFARFGIAIRRANLNQAFSDLGINATVESATELQKIAARLSILQKTLGSDVQNILGDVGRTQDEFANQLKSVQAAIKEASEQLGLPVTRALAPILGALRGLTQNVRDFIRTNPELTEALGVLIGTISSAGASLLTFGIALKVIPPIISLTLGPLGLFARALIAIPDIVLFPVAQGFNTFVGTFRLAAGIVRDFISFVTNIPTTGLNFLNKFVLTTPDPFKGFRRALTSTRKLIASYGRDLTRIQRNFATVRSAFQSFSRGQKERRSDNPRNFIATTNQLFRSAIRVRPVLDFASVQQSAERSIARLRRTFSNLNIGGLLTRGLDSIGREVVTPIVRELSRTGAQSTLGRFLGRARELRTQQNLFPGVLPERAQDRLLRTFVRIQNVLRSPVRLIDRRQLSAIRNDLQNLTVRSLRRSLDSARASLNTFRRFVRSFGPVPLDAHLRIAQVREVLSGLRSRLRNFSASIRVPVFITGLRNSLGLASQRFANFRSRTLPRLARSVTSTASTIFSGLTSAVTSLRSTLPTIQNFLGRAASAFTALRGIAAGAFSGVAESISGVIEVLKDLSGVIPVVGALGKALGSVAQFAVRLVANPFVLWIVGIASAVKLAVTFREEILSTIKSAASEAVSLTGSLVGVFQRGLSAARTFAVFVLRFFERIRGQIILSARIITSAFAQGNFVLGFETLAQTLRFLFLRFVSDFTNQFRSAITEVSSRVLSLFNGTVIPAASKFFDFAILGVNSIGQALIRLGDLALKLFDNVIARVVASALPIARLITDAVLSGLRSIPGIGALIPSESERAANRLKTAIDSAGGSADAFTRRLALVQASISEIGTGGFDGPAQVLKGVIPQAEAAAKLILSDARSIDREFRNVGVQILNVAERIRRTDPRQLFPDSSDVLELRDLINEATNRTAASLEVDFTSGDISSQINQSTERALAALGATPGQLSEPFQEASSRLQTALGSLSQEFTAFIISTNDTTSSAFDTIDSLVQGLAERSGAAADEARRNLFRLRAEVGRGALGNLLFQATENDADLTSFELTREQLAELQKIAEELNVGDLAGLQRFIEETGISFEDLLQKALDAKAGIASLTEIGAVLDRLRNGEVDLDVFEPTSNVRRQLNEIGGELSEGFEPNDFNALQRILRESTRETVNKITEDLGLNLARFNVQLAEASNIGDALSGLNESSLSSSTFRPTQAIDLLSSQGNQLVVDAINRRSSLADKISSNVEAIKNAILRAEQRFPQALEDAFDVRTVSI